MRLNIGGHKYAINEVKALEHEGKSLLGLHDARVCAIDLDEGLTHTRKMETLLHEVIHVILTNSGGNHDEGQIDAIANGLLQLGVGKYLWDKASK